jgi:hypothetical protein
MAEVSPLPIVPMFSPTPRERIVDALARQALARSPQSEMRAYHPSIRDRIAALLVGDDRGLRRNVVRGILGSTGIGTVPEGGLLDYVPGGGLLGAGDALRAGDYSMAAISIMPGGGPAGRAVKQALPMDAAARTAAKGGALHPPAVRVDDAARASQPVAIYDPPPQPPRPFAADYPPSLYPGGVPHDGSGRLTHDMEGRPLYARWIVGRNVVGGADEPLPAAQLGDFAAALTGHRVREVAENALRPGTAGTYTPYGGIPPVGQIRVLSGLPDDVRFRLVRHETGHGVQHHLVGDAFRRGVDVPVLPHLEGEYRRIYNDMNNPDRGLTGIDAWRGPHKPLPRYVVSPESRGYPLEKVERELGTEALRAYETDPNYIKTEAPVVAAFLRHIVNNHPTLSKIMQLNSVALPLGAAFAIAPDDRANAAE